MILVLLCLIIPGRALSSCSLDYIRVENESSHSGVLSWQGGPCDPGSPLEVVHVLWLSCPREESPSDIPPVRISYEDKGSSSLTLTGLVPYSLYQVNFGGREVRFRTEPDVPDVRPSFLAILPGKQSFHLEWRRGNKGEDCRAQNGVLGGYRVELWGLSSWVLNASGPLRTVHVGDNIYEYYFHELLPHTTYALRVYALNRGVPDANPGVYLKIKNRTLPTRPAPPSGLRIQPLNRSLFLEWDPEYPPSGEVEFYQLTLREAESGVIKKGYYVHRVDDRPTCTGDAECWVISYKDVRLGVPYTLNIRTKNVGVQELSQDSEDFHFTIPGPFPTQELKPPSHVSDNEFEALPEEDFHFYHSVTLIVLAVLGAAITVLIVIIIALVFKIKRDRLQSSGSGPYEGHKFSAHYRRGSGSTHITYIDRLHDIQSRCLPEPPPPLVKDPPEYSECVDDSEHYLSPLPEQEEGKPSSDLDVDGYLTPSFVRREDPRGGSSSSQLSSSSEKIQMKSYDRVWPPPLKQMSKESSGDTNLNYIDLENVIHQSVEDLIHSKTSSVV